MMRRKPDTEATSLPHAIAHCAISRALRPVLKHDVPFVACLVADNPDHLGIYEGAAERLLLQRDFQGIRTADDRASVCAFHDDVAVTVRMLADVQTYKRVCFVFANENIIPPEFKSSSEFVIALGPLDADLMMSAMYVYNGSRIASEDAQLIANTKWSDLRALFRKNRPTSQSIMRLRRARLLSETSISATKAPTTTQEELLAELDGYGDASIWGRQLVDDLASLKAGLIEWSAVERGLLLFGPSGTGKTRFARVLAKACDVPLISGSYAQWQSSGHQGDMLKAMRKAFDEATAKAPCILLIDELEVFDSRDKQSDHADYMRGIINGLLECLDGVHGREGVVVVGTTNYPDIIDRAILRPGRIDTHIEIGRPDGEARCRIFERYLGWKIPDENRQEVALATEGETGAGLEQSARQILRLCRRTMRAMSIDAVRSCLPKRLPVPAERAMISALHECGHAVVAIALGKELVEIQLAEFYVEDRVGYELGACRFTPTPFHGRMPSFLVDEICVALAGLAAEVEFIGAHRDGCGGPDGADLVRATDLATRCEAIYAMGESMVSESFRGSDDLARLRQANHIIWHRVDGLLKRQLDRTRALVREHRDFISSLAAHLMIVKSMSGEAVREFQAERGFSFTDDTPQRRAGGVG